MINPAADINDRNLKSVYRNCSMHEKTMSEILKSIIKLSLCLDIFFMSLKNTCSIRNIYPGRAGNDHAKISRLGAHSHRGKVHG